MSITVLASWYDNKFCYENNIDLYDGGLYYSELSKDYKKADFSALGNLPYGTKLRITYKGRSCIASKADVGRGGPEKAKIDLHINLAKKLRFDIEKGLDYVIIEKV